MKQQANRVALVIHLQWPRADNHNNTAIRRPRQGERVVDWISGRVTRLRLRDVTEDPPVVPDLTGPRKGLFTLSISINATIKEFRYMGFVRISLITKFPEFLDKPNELLQKWPQLIRYNANVDTDTPDQSLILRVSRPWSETNTDQIRNQSKFYWWINPKSESLQRKLLVASRRSL